MLIFCSTDFILVTVFCFAFKSQNKFDLCFSLPSGKGASGQVLVGAGGSCAASCRKGHRASLPQLSRLQRPWGKLFPGSGWFEVVACQRKLWGALSGTSAPCRVPVKKKMVFNCGIPTCLENSSAILVAGLSPVSRELFLHQYLTVRGCNSQWLKGTIRWFP